MICLLLGVISGVFYDVLYVARCLVCGPDVYEYTVKDKIFLIACDLLYCLAFAAGFIFVSVMFSFYGFRLYMFIGCVLGALVYLKSLHIIVAFFVGKVYNKITKVKEKRRGRAEAEQNQSGADGKHRSFNRHTRNSHNLSARHSRRTRKQKVAD